MRRRLHPALLLTLLPWISLPAGAGDPPTVEEIRRRLAAGQAPRAAELADEALGVAPPEQTGELLYLLFKAHVVDLGPDGKGRLYARVTDGVKDGMEIYESHLDGLEASIVSEGDAALPALMRTLQEGDRLDRLLVLGILEGMADRRAGLGWGDPAGTGIPSPIGAVRRAVRAAADDCAAREAAAGAAAGAAVFDNQLEREAYVQAAFAAETGLAFLALVDPDAWSAAAAHALVCRGAVPAVLDDRVRLERNAGRLRGPLRELLRGTDLPEARRRALELLGRYGDCGDLPVIEALREEEIGEAAGASADRIRRRRDCPG